MALPVYACLRTHDRALELFQGWPREGRVLEVAAGSGAFAARLQAVGFTMEACDLYPEQFGVPGIPVSFADLSRRLPYEDGRFACLSCLEGIEHLEDQFAFIRECWRVLEPGGRLLLSTPNILGLASRWRYFWTGFFPLATRPMNELRREPVHDHINLITYYELAIHPANHRLHGRAGDDGSPPHIGSAARLDAAAGVSGHPEGACP